MNIWRRMFEESFIFFSLQILMIIDDGKSAVRGFAHSCPSGDILVVVEGGTTRSRKKVGDTAPGVEKT